MYGFYDNPTEYTIDDLDFLAIVEGADEDRERILAAFADPECDAELEARAAQRSPDEWIFSVAPSETPRAIAAGMLAKSNDPATLDALARGCRFAEVVALVAHNPATSPETHRLLIQNEYAIICQGSAQALPMTEETYDLAAPHARVTLLARPDVTEEIVHRGATDPFSDARQHAAAHVLASPADLAVLITDEADDVAAQAAANPHTPLAALLSAMNDPRHKVRAGLARNICLPAEQMRTLVDFAIHLIDTTNPYPVPEGLSGDTLRAVFEAHDTADAILHAAVKRDDLGYGVVSKRPGGGGLD